MSDYSSRIRDFAGELGSDIAVDSLTRAGKNLGVDTLLNKINKSLSPKEEKELEAEEKAINASWWNQNKKWAVPTGIGVVGLGIVALLAKNEK